MITTRWAEDATLFTVLKVQYGHGLFTSSTVLWKFSMVKVCVYSPTSKLLLRRYNMQIHSALASDRSITMFFIWFEFLQTQFICFSITIVHPLDFILHADPWPVVFNVSVSGLSGTKEVAESQVLIGMGLLAGSTVMLLTLLWGSCVVVGKCDLSENSIATDSRDTKGFSLFGMLDIRCVFPHFRSIQFGHITHYRSIFKEHRCFSSRQKPYINQATAEGKPTQGLSLTRKQEI